MKQSWRLYLLVIFLILGGIFQFIDGFRSEGSPKTITAMELAGLNLQPFSINNTSSTAKKNMENDLKNFKGHKRRKLSMKDVMFPRNHSFDETKKKKKIAKKKDKKKGKKKADKSTQLIESTVSFQPKMYPEDNSKSNDNDGIKNDASPDSIGLLNNDPNTIKNGDIPQTFEEWEALVLRVAHKKNTAKLIEYQQSSLIPQDVFYQIVNAMLQDSRFALRKLGVEAAGATPSLQSFVALTKAMENESHGSEIRGLIVSRLASYQGLNHINFLRQVLSTSASDFSLIIAAQQVKLSAQKNLQPIEKTNDGQPAPQPNALQFDSLIPLLNTLSNTASSPQLIEAVQDAVQTIEDLLG